VTPDGGAKPSSEVQKRIDELTGELGRKNAKLEALEKKHNEAIEAAKSADEKRLDQLVQERTAPALKRLEAIENSMKAELDELLKTIPESAKPALASELSPVEDRLRNARAILALVGKPQGQPFTAGAVPASSEKRTYTHEQFVTWQNLPGKGMLKEWEEQRAEMNAAYREGRIVGI
jgi:hypothetical protein